jgi:hypothetical protein
VRASLFFARSSTIYLFFITEFTHASPPAIIIYVFLKLKEALATSVMIYLTVFHRTGITNKKNTKYQ